MSQEALMKSNNPSLTKKDSVKGLKNLSSEPPLSERKDKQDPSAKTVKLAQEFYSVSEAAELIGVCPESIRRWDRIGKICCQRTLGGHRRVPVTEILRLRTLRSRQQGKTSKPSKEIPSAAPLEHLIGLHPPTDRSILQQEPQLRDSPPPLSAESHEDPPRGFNAVKIHLKILRILLRSLLEHPAIGSIVKWLGELMDEVIQEAKTLSNLQSDWMVFTAALRKWQLDHQEHCCQLALKISTQTGYLPPAIASQAIPVTPQQTNNRWIHLRTKAASVFWTLVKAQYDPDRPEPEQHRAKELVDKILAPYQRLTRILATTTPGSLAHDVVRLLLNHRPGEFDIPRRTWSIRTLAQVCKRVFHTKAASKSQIQRFLKTLNWYTKPRFKLLSPDPRFGEKMRRLGRVLLHLTPNDCLVFGDAFRFTSRKVLEYVRTKFAPAGLQFELRTAVKRFFKSVCAIEVFGLWIPQQKQLELAELPQKTYRAFIARLIPLLRTYLETIPGTVYLVLDNAPYHCPKKLTSLLSLLFNDRVVVIFLPTHAPELNPIEQIWHHLLGAVDRWSDNPAELRALFQMALTRVRRYLATQPPKPLTLHCSVCSQTFTFSQKDPTPLTQELDTHLCFTLPGLNPYTLQVLTQGLDTSPLGH
jgi:DNA-binding transcriptional MerR regulator/transposase